LKPPLLLFLLILLLEKPAHAYLDPGNGGMMLQLILGGFAGIALMIKVLWKKLRPGRGNKDKE